MSDVDKKSHSYLLGVAEAEINSYRKILTALVRVVDEDLSRLPEGYAARKALDRAKARLQIDLVKENEAAT